MKMLLPVVGLLLVGVVALSLYLFKQGLDDYLANQSLAAVEIATPVGAETLSYDTSVGEALVGRAFNPDPEATDPANELLRRIDAASQGTNDGVVRVFADGDRRAVLSLRRAPYIPPPQTLASRIGADEPVPLPEVEVDVFGTIAGVDVILQPAPDANVGDKPVGYRHFVASIGDLAAPETVEITVLTDASDAFVASVFEGLDIVGLNERLPEPDVWVTADAGFVPTADGPLSQIPPGPSPALLAYELMQGGTPLTEGERAVMERVLAGEIANLTDLQTTFPDLMEPTAPMLAVLGPMTPAFSARISAARLLQSDRRWTRLETFILSRAVAIGTTQRDLTEYLASNEVISPDVLAVVDDLPVSSDDR